MSDTHQTSRVVFPLKLGQVALGLGILANLVAVIRFADSIKASIEVEGVYRKALEDRVTKLEQSDGDLKMWLASHVVARP